MSFINVGLCYHCPFGCWRRALSLNGKVSQFMFQWGKVVEVKTIGDQIAIYPVNLPSELLSWNLQKNTDGVCGCRLTKRNGQGVWRGLDTMAHFLVYFTKRHVNRVLCDGERVIWWFPKD